MDSNFMILATIHQPSTAVFHGFDKTMVLTGGEVCYSGPASTMVQYLSSIKKEVSSQKNNDADNNGMSDARPSQTRIHAFLRHFSSITLSDVMHCLLPCLTVLLLLLLLLFAIVAATEHQPSRVHSGPGQQGVHRRGDCEVHCGLLEQSVCR